LNKQKHLFTSESVCVGHPDKVADQISDAILDAMLTGDPMSRVACETLVTTGLVLVAGEITTKTYVDIPGVVRRTIKEIGYTDPSGGFHWETCAVIVTIDKQSPDIARGVDTGGAGDQGLMFGYACRETKELMPMPIALAHQLAQRLAFVREKGILPYLRPDGKTQVTIEYENGKPKRVHTIVVSSQHKATVTQAKIRRDVIRHVVKPVVPAGLLDSKTIYHVNPTGKFVVGGPQADCGMTGRKLIVDTYGGKGSHGGGSFSGKDPSKVDRSASYMARHIAKNIVAAGLADEVEVQLAYAIGVADPVSVMVDACGTGKLSDAAFEKLIRKHFPLTPKGMIDYLKLRRPIYKETARHGHFGRRHPNFTWEETNKAAELKKAAAKLK
jgi:S-adenosylmethionine synthetase